MFGPALLSILMLAAQAGMAASVRDGPDTIWYVIAAEGGDVLGYAAREVRPRAGGREVIDTSETRLQEMGDPARRVTDRTVTLQDSNGRALSILKESRIGGEWSRVEAEIGAREVRLTRHTQADRRTMHVPIGDGVRFDAGEGLLPGWDMAATPRLEFENFNVEAMQVERIVIEAVPGAAADAEGRIPVIRRRFEGDDLRTLARLLLDRQRRIVAITQPLFGTSISSRVADRETALRPHPPYRPFAAMMVRAPFRVSPSAMQGHIRYRFGFRDGLAFAPPQTGEQRVTTRPDGIVLDICAACGEGLPTDPAALAHALQSTPWLQSDHPTLREIARPAAISRSNQARKMELLVERGRPYLGDVDYAGHFSALETVRRRMGDCTEAAVLLAALGRAAGIPTRVVSGLVYMRNRYHGVTNAFMPHSWVVAYVDGKWRSYDMALGSFDNSHIALAIGDGEPRAIMAATQLASLLSWDDVMEVRARPWP